MIDPQLRDFFRQKGISIEALDTVRPSHSSALSLSLFRRAAAKVGDWWTD